MTASSVKAINKLKYFYHVPIQVSQDGFMLKLIIGVFLGCDLPKQLLLQSLSSVCDDTPCIYVHTLADCFHQV